MPVKKERQYRNLQAQSLQNNEDYVVEGYAMTWQRYKLYDTDDGPVYETFERSAFNECDMSDVIMQYDHNGKVFARTSNNTLVIDLDEKGMHIRADLGKTAASRDMYEEINSGLVTRMSWGFMPKNFYFDKNTRTLVHTKISKVYDVSAVSIPANDTTEIHARSLVDGEIDKMMQELQVQERNKEKLLLKLKIEGVD